MDTLHGGGIHTAVANSERARQSKASKADGWVTYAAVTFASLERFHRGEKPHSVHTYREKGPRRDGNPIKASCLMRCPCMSSAVFPCSVVHTG